MNSCLVLAFFFALVFLNASKHRLLMFESTGMFLATELGDIGQVIEDNVLALLDTNGVKNSDDIEDDSMHPI